MQLNSRTNCKTKNWNTNKKQFEKKSKVSATKLTIWSESYIQKSSLNIFCVGNKYYVNDMDKGIAFKADEIKMDNNISYRMGVSLCNPKESVTITDFRCLAVEWAVKSLKISKNNA